MQPQQHDPFEFIMNPGGPQQAPQQRFSGAGTSMGKRLFVVGVSFVLLIIVVMVFFSIIGSSGKGTITDLIAVASDQAVLSDISQQAVQKGISQTVKNLGVNSELSITSSHLQFLSLVKNEGSTLSATAANALNPTYDSTLLSALQSGTFDTTYIQLMQQELQKYRSDMNKSYSDSSLIKRRQLLIAMDQQAKLLQTQLAKTVPTTT